MTDAALILPAETIEAIAQRAAELVSERPTSPVDGWLTVAEAADYIRAPKSRVYSLVSAERIPYVKDGSRTLFRRSQLDAWLEAGGGVRP